MGPCIRERRDPNDKVRSDRQASARRTQVWPQPALTVPHSPAARRNIGARQLADTHLVGRAGAKGFRFLERHHSRWTLFTVVSAPIKPPANAILLILGGVAQWMLTEAWASAQVSAVAPYSYSALVWAIGLGFVVWGDVPGVTMLAGSALIVAAGLYILHRELVRRRARAEGDTTR